MYHEYNTRLIYSTVHNGYRTNIIGTSLSLSLSLSVQALACIPGVCAHACMHMCVCVCVCVCVGWGVVWCGVMWCGVVWCVCVCVRAWDKHTHAHRGRDSETVRECDLKFIQIRIHRIKTLTDRSLVSKWFDYPPYPLWFLSPSQFLHRQKNQ